MTIKSSISFSGNPSISKNYYLQEVTLYGTKNPVLIKTPKLDSPIFQDGPLKWITEEGEEDFLDLKQEEIHQLFLTARFFKPTTSRLTDHAKQEENDCAGLSKRIEILGKKEIEKGHLYEILIICDSILGISAEIIKK